MIALAPVLTMALASVLLNCRLLYNDNEVSKLTIASSLWPDSER